MARRGGPIGTCAFAMLVVMLAVAPASGGGSPKAHGPVAVRIAQARQTAILRSGRVVVRVRSHRPGRVAVSVRARLSKKGARERRITRSRTLTFRRPGVKVARLRLRSSARKGLGGCNPQRLIAVGRFRLTRSPRNRARKSARSSRPLSRRVACPSGGPEDPLSKPYTGPKIDTGAAERCDWLDSSVCLYPFPNDFFTKPAPETGSGRRVDFNLLAMPKNKAGKPVDTAELNRNDGFSPGSSIITKVPGLDNPQAFQRTGAVPQTDIGRYDDPGQPVVLVDADTHRLAPIFSELDSNPQNRSDVTLLVRPAVNLEEGHRYIVALRNLKNENGDTLEPRNSFRVYRDRLTTDQPVVESRRRAMEGIFGDLQQADVARSNLYLAWDFTVASKRDLTERMLHIRDDAFAKLGDTNLADLQVQGASPSFSVSQTQDFTVAQNDKIARKVTGTVTVPCYMNTPGCSPVGSTFNYTGGSGGLPAQLPGNDASVSFTCLIPRSAASGPQVVPARPSLYGHGLLGSQGEVEAGNVETMANAHNFMFCATDWYGFATTNLPNVAAILQDISQGPLLFDETQQGMLNFLYLGRAMIHPQGFASNPAFQVGGSSVIDTTRLFYDGNSQGGILGGSLTAVAPDFNRAVLGVPGMNYSTLLQRSVDFEPYAQGRFGGAVCGALGLPVCPVDDTALGLYDNYPNELERPLIFALLQMLWDRAEANGYAAHMTTDPLRNTPSHAVLMHLAFGDHQVANVAAEVEARTIGASVYQPALNAGRHPDSVPFFGLGAVPSFPFGGSALVYWDGGPLGVPGGTATPPAANVPPRPPTYGADPHSYPRADPKAMAQKSAFLSVGGELINPCVDGSGQAIPCYSHGYTGP